MSLLAASPSLSPTSAGSPADPARGALVEQILALNPTADVRFLSQFGARSLETYLAHLEAARVPRGPDARWVRRPESPAIVWREAQD
jgi:hypothetical protein